MWLNTVQLGSCRWFAQFVVTRATTIGVVHRKDKKAVSSSCVWGGMPCWCQRSDWADWVIATGYNQRQRNIYVYCVYMLKRTHRSLVIKIYVTANVLACFNTFPHSFWMMGDIYPKGAGLSGIYPLAGIEASFVTSSQLAWLSLRVGAYIFFHHISRVSCQMLLPWVWKRLLCRVKCGVKYIWTRDLQSTSVLLRCVVCLCMFYTENCS